MIIMDQSQDTLQNDILNNTVSYIDDTVYSTMIASIGGYDKQSSITVSEFDKGISNLSNLKMVENIRIVNIGYSLKYDLYSANNEFESHFNTKYKSDIDNILWNMENQIQDNTSLNSYTIYETEKQISQLTGTDTYTISNYIKSDLFTQGQVVLETNKNYTYSKDTITSSIYIPSNSLGLDDQSRYIESNTPNMSYTKYRIDITINKSEILEPYIKLYSYFTLLYYLFIFFLFASLIVLIFYVISNFKKMVNEGGDVTIAYNSPTPDINHDYLYHILRRIFNKFNKIFKR